MAVFLSGLLLGNIWFWKDDDGVRHYSNVGPPQGRAAGELKESREISKKLRDSDRAGHLFHVIKIFDGDTARVSGLDLVFTIRFAGIDAPEIGYDGRPDQPYGRTSKAYLSRRIANRKVSLKGYGSGGYNRQLAEIFLDGNNINLEMVRAGLAEVYRGRLPKGLDIDAYQAAETRARAKKTGMWQQGDAYKSPRRWRKMYPRR